MVFLKKKKKKKKKRPKWSLLLKEKELEYVGSLRTVSHASHLSPMLLQVGMPAVPGGV